MRMRYVLAVITAMACAQSLGAQAGPVGTVLVANMDDDSVWLIDLETGLHRATVATHIAPARGSGVRRRENRGGDELRR